MWNVRFGSKADMCTAIGHVRFTPNSDSKSGLPQKVMSACVVQIRMSALGQKTDMRRAAAIVDLGGVARGDLVSYAGQKLGATPYLHFGWHGWMKAGGVLNGLPRELRSNI
jgi:hypothetical protein